MYPSLSSIGNAGNSFRPDPPPPLPSGSPPAASTSAWGITSNSSLRVKIADEYKLDPAAAFDYEFERQVMQEEASTSATSFMALSEASYYKDTGVDKFLSMGFSVAAVSLAVAYQASHGGDQNQVVDFCNNYTQLLGMGFAPTAAAGALVKTKNDLSAATELCLSGSG